MSDTVIDFRNVTFKYEAEDGDSAPKKPALEDVTFSVGRGEFIAVLGHNGSGKSTLAKLCNAIYEPDSGSVTVEGIDTHGEENGDLIRRKVGMVFQNPDNQIVATIVEDDVAFGPENLGVEPKEIRRRVDEALKAVNMYDLRLRQPHNLSGGQKQRVAIAGALAMNTECIVLDEPTAMLDPAGRQEVMGIIRKLNKEKGMTVVLITHFMDEAVRADRVLVMAKGRLVADGTPAEIFSDHKRLESYGLDAPQAAKLAKGLGLAPGLLTPEAVAEELIRRMGGAVG